MLRPLCLLLFAVLCFWCYQCSALAAKPHSRHLRIHSAVNTLSKPTAPRIFGGSNAAEGAFPFMVFFIYSPPHDFYKATSSCSAALLTPEWVLLAAHCFQDQPTVIDGVILVAGKADLSGYVNKRFATPFWSTIDEQQFGVQERRADQVRIHPDYGYDDKTHDIALVHVKTPFILGNSVQSIGMSRQEMRTRMPCTILGWGLSEGNQRTYHLVFADEVYARSVIEGCQYKADGNFLCLERATKGICQGDSGSPLVCDNMVWGVASHLVSYEDNPDCGDDFEEYYEELYYDLDWVGQQLSNAPVTTDGSPVPGGNGGRGGASQPLPQLLVLLSMAILVASSSPFLKNLVGRGV